MTPTTFHGGYFDGLNVNLHETPSEVLVSEVTEEYGQKREMISIFPLSEYMEMGAQVGDEWSGKRYHIDPYCKVSDATVLYFATR